MTTEHAEVRSGKSKRKPSNSNVVDFVDWRSASVGSTFWPGEVLRPESRFADVRDGLLMVFVARATCDRLALRSGHLELYDHVVGAGGHRMRIAISLN